MATEMIRQTMFTTGEADQTTWKRTDQPEGYLTSAQSLLNMETGTTGLAKKRRGTTSLINTSGLSGQTSKMYEFQDETGVFYIVVSNDLSMEIYQIQEDQSLIHYQSVVTPYPFNELPYIDYTLNSDVLVLTHPRYPVARLFVSTYIPQATFTYEVLQIYPLPSFDFGDINYNIATVSSIGGPSGNVGTNITLRFTLAGDFGGLAAAQAWVGGQIIAAGTSETSPIGYFIINTVTQPAGAGTIDFTGTVRVSIQIPVSTNGDQYSVRKPAFLAGPDTFNRGYPAKTNFYQNRLWLANTAQLPTTLFGSQINGPVNYDVGTGSDTDAIIYTLGQTNTGAIQWLNGGKQLEVYTSNYEFVCPQDQNSGLTPGTFAIRQQSSYGSSSSMKPVTYINDSYYVNKSENTIINFHFEGVGLAYTSSNVSIISSHLVKKPYNRAIQRGTATSQDNFIYFLNNDNSLTSFQFAKESKLASLTPIKFKVENNVSTVIVVDIASINNEIYFLKVIVSSGQFFIEKFDDSQRIDSSYQTTLTSDGVITGLDQFESNTVQVVFNGQDYGQYQVVGGQITVSNPSGYTGTTYVGYLYDNEIIPMYIFSGSNQTYYYKQVTRIYVDYYQSLNFYINGNLVNFQYMSDIQAGLPLTPRTDTAIIDVVNGPDRFQTFSITQSSPFDLQILGIAYQTKGSIIGD